MLTRGPAGFRFTAKGLQHAMPDAKVDRDEVTTAGDELKARVRLSGTLRDSGQAVETVVDITLRMTSAGRVEIAEATMDANTLERIRQARRS
jgi:hypothetical protein